jgi:hypothetical protein
MKDRFEAPLIVQYACINVAVYAAAGIALAAASTLQAELQLFQS